MYEGTRVSQWIKYQKFYVENENPKYSAINLSHFRHGENPAAYRLCSVRYRT